MQSIHHVVTINASPARVYEAISTTSGLAGWWTTDVSGSAERGAVITFHFTGEFDPRMRVTSVQSGLGVTWELAGGHPNWDGSTFEFQLEPNFTPGGYTVYFGFFTGDTRFKVTRGQNHENRAIAGVLNVR